MTSISMGVQLTPGQRCLLDLLQRKLLKTIHLYAKLSLERRDSGAREEIEAELSKLKEKIRRISARQKRFTLEIINGNGNNTIPKECFFKALGLVTKEALSKLNSKTNERRRRTTANPRFSHEAIQAKRALEPLQKRLESRVKDKRESASKKPQSQPSNNSESGNAININKNNVTGGSSNNSNSTTNNNSNNTINNASGTRSGNQQALNSSESTRSSSRSTSSRNRNLMIHNERQELLNRFGKLQRQINTKVSQIKDKQASNNRLERQNELIRKRGLDIISAINMINPNLTFHEESQLPLEHNNNNSANHTTNNQNDHTMQQAEPLDIWIDMKCDESLDGLD